MAEVVSELDKLREAAKLIEEMSQGRLQVAPASWDRSISGRKTKPTLGWICESTAFQVSYAIE